MEPQLSYVRVKRCGKSVTTHTMMFVSFNPGVDSGLLMRQKVASFFQMDFHACFLFSVVPANVDRTEFRKQLIADQLVLTAQNTDESSLWYICLGDDFESLDPKTL